MRGKNAQVVVFSIMLGFVIIILALALTPIISETTESAMNQSIGDTIGMDCQNSSISPFNKAGCVATSISPFWFVGAMILIGGGVVVAKFA